MVGDVYFAEFPRQHYLMLLEHSPNSGMLFGFDAKVDGFRSKRGLFLATVGYTSVSEMPIYDVHVAEVYLSLTIIVLFRLRYKGTNEYHRTFG